GWGGRCGGGRERRGGGGGGRGGCRGCRYRLRTRRQPLPPRELLAASGAPQGSRLPHVIPPERSQNRAAAGRQGARSFMMSALAAVTERPKTRTPSNVFVMPLSVPSCWRRACPRRSQTQMPAQICAPHTCRQDK